MIAGNDGTETSGGTREGPARELTGNQQGLAQEPDQQDMAREMAGIWQGNWQGDQQRRDRRGEWRSKPDWNGDRRGRDGEGTGADTGQGFDAGSGLAAAPYFSQMHLTARGEGQQRDKTARY
jgi:hypothetical protein